MLRRVAEICIRLKGKDRIGSRDVYDAEHGYVTCLQKRSDWNGGSPSNFRTATGNGPVLCIHSLKPDGSSRYKT